MRSFLSVKKLTIALGFVLLVLAILWLFYGLFGHRLIDAVYHNRSIDLVNKIMAGRGITPVQDYYARADQLLIELSGNVFIAVVVLALLVVLIKRPIETVLACSSVMFFSLGLFSVLELFPSLIGPLKLAKLGYYSQKVSKVGDDTLGFRYTPGMRVSIRNNRSSLYSPAYGVEVEPKTIEWVTNKDGFRGESDAGVSDVVLIGDSFIEFGETEASTFGKLLEQELNGRKVRNLGISGYSPLHYLEVLKRYAIKVKPKVVLFCFYEGNDIQGVREYLNWKKDKTADLAGYELTSKSFMQRYRLLAGEIIENIQGAVRLGAELLLKRITQAQYTHPRIVVLKLSNGDKHRVLFLDQPPALSVEEMLGSEDWRELKKILVEFKNISAEHEITPLILHIPMVASVYAEYSTEESGSNWLKIRQTVLGRARNMENAMQILARQVGMEFVNLSIPFRGKAKQGELLYEPIDTHWNLRGREIAASYVARALKARGL